MPNRQVYGKRTTAREHLRAAQCFGASSSPSKPLQSPSLADVESVTANKAGLEPVRRHRDHNAGAGKQKEVGLDALAQKLECMQLEDQLRSEPPATENVSENLFDSSILKTRDPNPIRARRPRQRQGGAKEKLQRVQNTQVDVNENSLIFEEYEPGVNAVSESFPLRETHENRESKKRSTYKCSPSAHESPISRHKPEIPSSPRHQDQIACHTSAPTHVDCIETIAYAKPLLDLCSDPRARLAPADFQSWADALSVYFKISKIAEASYGEVYRLSLLSPCPGLARSDESVLKIIALKQPPQFAATPIKPGKGQRERKPLRESKKQLAMSAVVDVASEVRLLQRMSPVPGWTNFREFHLVRGTLPTQFVRAWREFNKNVKKSEFPDPGRKGSYGEEQLWAVVEMQDAGTDLETMMEKEEAMEIVRDVEVVWDIFWGVACAVAKGEEWACFEHRDLHLGNICVRPTTLPPPSSASYRKLGFTGLETTIIDYTLSRASMTTNTTPSTPSPHKRMTPPSSAAETAYFDLSKDPAIFQGDAAKDYQYAIYRFMRSAVLLGDPAAEAPTPIPSRKKLAKPDGREKEADAWRRHHPLTNLVWLHFVLHTLLAHLAKPVSSQRSLASATKTDQRRREVLRDRLQALARRLEVEGLKDCGFGSAADVVGWAVAEGWLDVEDVVGGEHEAGGGGAVGEGYVEVERSSEVQGRPPRAQRRRRRRRS